MLDAQTMLVFFAGGCRTAADCQLAVEVWFIVCTGQWTEIALNNLSARSGVGRASFQSRCTNSMMSFDIRHKSVDSGHAPPYLDCREIWVQIQRTRTRRVSRSGHGEVS